MMKRSYLDDELSPVLGADCFDSENIKPAKQPAAFVRPQFIPVSIRKQIKRLHAESSVLKTEILHH